MILSDYRTAVQDLLHDPNAQFYSVAQLNRWINLARKKTAYKGQCIRILPTSLNTVANQEKYQFSTVNALITAQNTGVATLIGVQSISISWGSMKPMLDYVDWSGLQAYLRSYNLGFTNYPMIWSQYGQGVTGSVYLWPTPSQVSQMDWDCYCLPSDLTSDGSTDAIPAPWDSDVVPWYAASLAYRNAQRKDDAANMESEWNKKLSELRDATTPTRIPSMYPPGF